MCSSDLYGRATRDGSIVESYNFGTSMFIRANPKRKEQIVDFNGELHYYVDIKYYTNPYHKVLDILTGEQFQHHLEMLKLLEV